MKVLLLTGCLAVLIGPPALARVRHPGGAAHARFTHTAPRHHAGRHGGRQSASVRDQRDGGGYGARGSDDRGFGPDGQDESDDQAQPDPDGSLMLPGNASEDPAMPV